MDIRDISGCVYCFTSETAKPSVSLRCVGRATRESRSTSVISNAVAGQQRCRRSSHANAYLLTAARRGEVCFYIPILVNNDLFQPRPPEEVEGPFPIPWIIARGIETQLAHDLRAIATVHTLVASMSPEVGRPIQTALEESVKNVAGSLPEGVSLRTQTSG
jgi:hypothetical protein